MTTVYKNYDQTELDRQYNVRAGVAAYEAIFERWTERSEAFRRRAGGAARVDLAYGDDPLQTLDLFSSGKARAPLVVFIHGGYWQSLDKAQFGFLAEPFLGDGLDVAMVNYRLAPVVGIAAIIEDCRSSLAWLFRHADQFGYDGTRLIVVGSSAGGHLAATMLATDWPKHGVPADAIKGCCALSGLYDLEPIRLSYLNEVIGLDTQTAIEASPINMVPAAAPPLRLSTGGDETDEFRCQQSELAERWRGRGLDCCVIPQSDGHHFDMIDRLGTKGSTLYDAVVALAWVEAARSNSQTKGAT